MSAQLIEVDNATRTRRRVRHVARIIGDVAVTQCGFYLRNYWRARDREGIPTSYITATGKRYAIPCRTCLPQDFHSQFQQGASRDERTYSD
ncbi:MAG: hypothetical protein AB7U82_27550 [Blastocatellales bacterium]